MGRDRGAPRRGAAGDRQARQAVRALPPGRRARARRLDARAALVGRTARAAVAELGAVAPGVMKIYLAGPEVFLPDAVAVGAAKIALCRDAGCIGLYALEPAEAPPADAAPLLRAQ